ncbi:MAG: hypothetical protein IJA58_04135 [Lachnospiraceae bacterium]|nr:hypothetical protein [Lachnospiraceae bacterium]
MKKKLLTTTLMMALILLLTACGCKHEWKEASCTEAKTCTLCGEIEGEALGHTWQEASCETKKTCSTCNITEGEVLGHDWQDATTEAPKTCARCQLMEGEKIITDPRFTTASTLDLQGTWICETNMSGEMLGAPTGFPNGVDCTLSMEFGNSGNLAYKFTLKDEAAFKKDYREFTIEQTYSTLAQQGFNKEAADAAILQNTGMTMEAYVDYVLQSFDFGSLFQAFNITEVYYVKDGKIYTAMSWSSPLFEDSAYTLKDGILIIDAVTLVEGGEPMQWKKAD